MPSPGRKGEQFPYGKELEGQTYNNETFLKNRVESGISSVVSLDDIFDEAENIGELKGNEAAAYQIGSTYPAESVNIHIPSNHFKFIRAKSALPSMARGGGKGAASRRKLKTANGRRDQSTVLRRTPSEAKLMQLNR